MSDDLTLVLREGGVDRFAYTRWGASQLQRDLLVGPTAFVEFVRGLPALEQPPLMRWLQGLVIVDLDAESLVYWAAQFGTKSPAGRKLIAALLAELWPGWELQWLHDPWGFAQSRFDVEPSGVHTLAAISIDEFVEEQDRVWEASRTQPGVIEWIADVGEDEVRSTLEVESHCSLCVIGTEVALVAENWVPNLLARVGPAALDVISTRPDLPVAELRYRDLQAVYLIDPEARDLQWWLGAPRWNEHPARAFAAHWPDWTHRPVDDGPDEACRRFGPPAYPLGPNHVHQLHSLRDRIVGERPSGARALTAVAAAIAPEPGERVVVTPAGPGDDGPAGSTKLEPLIDRVVRSMTASPEPQ